MWALRDDALELVFAHGLPERLPILEWFRRVPAGTVQAEAVEDATTLAVRLRHDAIVLHAQHVERNEAERDRRVPVKDGLADEREVRFTFAVECDQLAVEHGAGGKL